MLSPSLIPITLALGDSRTTIGMKRYSKFCLQVKIAEPDLPRIMRGRELYQSRVQLVWFRNIFVRLDV